MFGAPLIPGPFASIVAALAMSPDTAESAKPSLTLIGLIEEILAGRRRTRNLMQTNTVDQQPGLCRLALHEDDRRHAALDPRRHIGGPVHLLVEEIRKTRRCDLPWR